MKRKKSDPTPDNPYITFATVFNFFDPDQRKMIEHISKRTNVSDYFRRLVQRDMDGRSYSAPASIVELPEASDEAFSVDVSLISGLI
jgi:hypothetical protein